MEKSSALNIPILFCQYAIIQAPLPKISSADDLRECFLDTRIGQRDLTALRVGIAHLMTFAMNASIWKIFFAPRRILNSCLSVTAQISAQTTHVMCCPMNDLWLEIIVHSVHYTLGDSLLRELLAFVFFLSGGLN